jgi:hypothetical protein
MIDTRLSRCRLHKRVYNGVVSDQSNTARQPHKPAFSSARGRGGVLLVWGDGYYDGFLAVEIFSKKRLKVLESRGIR